MFDNLIDNLDFLHINSKNATRLIQAVSNVCFAFLLYDFSGGKVIFPKDISTKVIFDFVYSYQIIIPIVVYIITWGTFYWFFKPVFSNVINFISYITSNLSKSKKSSNPIDVINSKTKIALKIEPNEITAETLESNFKELRIKVKNQVDESLNMLIIFIQITIIFILKISNNSPFYGFVNQLIIIAFIIGIVFIALKIHKIFNAERFVIRLKDYISNDINKDSN